MNEVFDLIFEMFGNVIMWLKAIPVTDNVSLFDFSIAILVMSIVIVAFVPIVSVGSTNYVNETLKAERAAERERDREDKAVEREKERNSYEFYKTKRSRNEAYNRRYNDEMRGK